MSTELIVILFLLCFIVFLEVKNYHERKKLTEKIMSRNYEDYAQHEYNMLDLKKRPKKQDEELNYL
jgi:hypothetical protein